MDAAETKTSNKALIVVTIILSIAVVALGILYGISMSSLNSYQATLENVYQKNFYELVDEVNNAETKLNKVLASNSASYKSKLLKEISKNASEAQTRLNMLPYSINGLSDTISFVNQVSGYTETLAKTLENGQNLSKNDEETLEKVYESIVNIKKSLNSMSKQMWEGYNITDSSLKLDGDYNNLTSDMSAMNGEDIEYPTMIYDGPFSDSQVNKEVKGLNFGEVSMETAKSNLGKVLTGVNMDNFDFQGESKGHFTTYDFSYEDENGAYTFAQVTKKGGKLLTLSSQNIYKTKKLELENAEKIALDFAKKADISNMKVVWSDVIGDDAFINLAPVLDGVIIYPDLVKVKVDLTKGNVLGFEASSYYMNHVDRKIMPTRITQSVAKAKLYSGLKVKDTRLALIPLEYDKEVLCYEFICTMNGNTYYVYINAVNGAEENILKVIQTDNGNLLL